MNINQLNQLYKSPAGDKLAREELLPVVGRYLGARARPKILEVGCGFGRNLVALSEISGAQVFGCDFSVVELRKAEERLRARGITNVELVHQTDESRLPFENNTFDLVVAWQLLEHVPSRAVKARLITEMTRVVKDEGLLLIETPNFWFPIDYHDNRLPFVHWFLRDKWRYRLTRLVRDEDFPPSQYTSILELRGWLRGSPHVRSWNQLSKIYFEERYTDVFRHLGGTNLRFKKIFFLIYFPLYLLLRLGRLPGDLFTPSVRVVFQINDSKEDHTLTQI